MTYRWVNQRRLRIWQLFLFSLAVVWGIDYWLTPDWAVASSVSIIERAFPLQVWGWFFLLSGVGGLAGEAWMAFCRKIVPLPGALLPWPMREKNRWWPSFVAHTSLLALYATLGFGYLLNMIEDWQLWGLRVPALMWAFALSHWVFMRRHENVRPAL